MEAFHATHTRIPQLPDLMLIIGVGFGVTGFAHLLAEFIQPWMVEHVPGGARYSLHSGFFWLIVIASLMGLGLSFTRARKLEAAGASKTGSAMLYILSQSTTPSTRLHFRTRRKPDSHRSSPRASVTGASLACTNR